MKLLDPDAGIDQYHQSVLIASKSLEAKLAAWELQSDQPGGGMMLRKEIERSARARIWPHSAQNSGRRAALIKAERRTRLEARTLEAFGA
jgi:hypothetical protein